MSLILREICQPLLDQYNLNDYHAHININNELAVVGTCGKPLLVLSGVRFSRKSPAQKEIDYSYKLLLEFLVSHKKSIDKYFKVAAEHAKQKASFSTVENKYSFKDSIPYNYTSKQLENAYGTITLKNDDFTVSYTSNPNAKKPMEIELKVASIKEIRPGDISKCVTEMKRGLKKYLDFTVADKHFDKARAELSSCNI